MSSKEQKTRLARRSRTKGATYERWVAKQLQVVYPKAKRGLGQARSGGEIPDVEGTSWWIETKARKSISVHAALAQATTASAACQNSKYKGRPPLAVTRVQGGKDIVSMYLEDFIRLLLEGDL